MTAHTFRFVPLAAGVAFVALAGSALAYVCHPNGKGTLTKTVDGTVSGIELRSQDAVFLANTGNRCSRVVWSLTTGSARSVPVGCNQVAATRRPASAASPSAVSHGVRMTVDPGNVGRPPSLQVRGRNGALLRVLALPARPSTLAASDGLAVFSATRGEGLFAVRLSDGLYTYLGPDGGSFRAVLGPRGVLFHDGESRRALREGKTILKFVPRRAILQSVSKTAAPLVVGGPIHSISMDGPRVALSVGDVRSVCDRVLYWNVAWRPVQRISAPSGPTCRPGHTGVGIGRLAIGGFRTEWLTSEKWLIAGSPLCQEWVVRRGGKVGAMAGSGRTLAFAVGRTVAIVDGRYRPRVIATGAGAPLALATDPRRVAILWPDSRVEVRGLGGRVLAAITAVADARRVALEGDTLVAAGASGIDLYSLRSGKRVAHRPLPDGATGLAFHYGIAAFAAGRDALIVDTRTGRTAVAGRGTAPLLGVQISSAGLAYAYGRVARFVPTQELFRLLGR